MLQQRVHFEKDDGMVVHVDLDPGFSRHTFQASNLAANDQTVDLPKPDDQEMENLENINPEEGVQDDQNALDNAEEDEENALDGANFEERAPEGNEFKKPKSKKRKKKKGLSCVYRSRNSSATRKPYQSCLPNSIRECTWLENTEQNIKLLEQKNQEILKKRELKKADDKKKQDELKQRLEERGINLMEDIQLSHQ